jgi:hypothetical protein
MALVDGLFTMHITIYTISVMEQCIADLSALVFNNLSSLYMMELSGSYIFN